MADAGPVLLHVRAGGQWLAHEYFFYDLKCLQRDLAGDGKCDRDHHRAAARSGKAGGGKGHRPQADLLSRWQAVLGLRAVLVGLAFVFPHIYNTEQSVRALATQFILISAVMMPVQAFLNASYFTIRSGGKTGITFFFDGGFMWICTIPLAFVLSRFSGFPILATYICCARFG